jgi:hypothetical protein
VLDLAGDLASFEGPAKDHHVVFAVLYQQDAQRV